MFTTSTDFIGRYTMNTKKKDYLDGILLTYMVFSWRRLATQNEEMSVNN
jgi:hypothetical protein